MEIEKKKFRTDLILTGAIMDMAEEDGITWQEARSKIINSNAYTALYDLETGLWETDQITSEISTRKQHK